MATACRVSTRPSLLLGAQKTEDPLDRPGRPTPTGYRTVLPPTPAIGVRRMYLLCRPRHLHAQTQHAQGFRLASQPPPWPASGRTQSCPAADPCTDDLLVLFRDGLLCLGVPRDIILSSSQLLRRRNRPHDGRRGEASAIPDPPCFDISSFPHPQTFVLFVSFLPPPSLYPSYFCCWLV